MHGQPNQPRDLLALIAFAMIVAVVLLWLHAVGKYLARLAIEDATDAAPHGRIYYSGDPDIHPTWPHPQPERGTVPDTPSAPVHLFDYGNLLDVRVADIQREAGQLLASASQDAGSGLWTVAIRGARPGDWARTAGQTFAGAIAVLNFAFPQLNYRGATE